MCSLSRQLLLTISAATPFGCLVKPVKESLAPLSWTLLSPERETTLSIDVTLVAEPELTLDELF